MRLNAISLKKLTPGRELLRNMAQTGDKEKAVVPVREHKSAD
jgi:hypothetical protein